MNFRTVFCLCVMTGASGIVWMASQARSADKPAKKASPGETAKAEPAPDRTKTRGGAAPAKADTLLMSYPNDPDTVNMLIANDNVSTAFQRWVYESLADQKFDDPDAFERALAEDWNFDKKNLVFTIKLRKGVKWHPMKLPNGKALPNKEVTSRDVKFT